MMTTKIFKDLQDHYQILENIPIRLPKKFEKCYFGKMSLRLVFDMPDSNRNWKNRYFFIQGTDWVCR